MSNLGTILRGLRKGLELINTVQRGHGWTCLAKVPGVENISHYPYTVLHDSFQTARDQLTQAEIELFLHGDPGSINYNSATLQDQVRVTRVLSTTILSNFRTR